MTTERRQILATPLSQLREILDRSRPAARHTPSFALAAASEALGGEIVVKAESLQLTGSFKLRGALAKAGELAPGVRGIVAGSVGNHAQAVALAARMNGLQCRVYMPEHAAVAKVEAVQRTGAHVVQEGDSVDACVEAARADVGDGFAFVHPFEDPAVIRGQAGVGLELLDDRPRVRRVLVPVGGGGLACGIALAIRRRCPDIEVIGVEAAACPAYAAEPSHADAVLRTIADGIAVKRPSPLTGALLRDLLDGLATVEERDIAEAVCFLATHAGIVAEGAGAVGLAALASGAVPPAPDGETAVIVSGGNIDLGLLAGLIGAHETTARRRTRIETCVDDLPGRLAALLARVADAGANVLAVTCGRDGIVRAPRQTAIEVVIETRSATHAARVVTALDAAGYAVRAAQEDCADLPVRHVRFGDQDNLRPLGLA